jgi:hypothetical protein
MHEYFITSWFCPRYSPVPFATVFLGSVTRKFGRCAPTHAHRTLFFRIAPPGKTNGILLYRKKSSNKKAVFPSNRYINKYMIHRVDRPTLMLIFAPSPLKIPLSFLQCAVKSDKYSSFFFSLPLTVLLIYCLVGLITGWRVAV